MPTDHFMLAIDDAFCFIGWILRCDSAKWKSIGSGVYGQGDGHGSTLELSICPTRIGFLLPSKR